MIIIKRLPFHKSKFVNKVQSIFLIFLSSTKNVKESSDPAALLYLSKENCFASLFRMRTRGAVVGGEGGREREERGGGGVGRGRGAGLTT